MNYEKEYKEALERARKINSGEGVSAPPDWTICEVIFPELKENEDEKIRKAILNCFIKCWGNCKGEIYGIHAEDAIAWLEKQGQTFTKKDVDDAYLRGVSDAKHELEKQSEQKPYGQREECLDCQFNYAGECKGFCQMKRGEQKPADKVEPKFHKGEWIVWQNKCYKVNDTSCDYELIDQNGLSTFLEYGTIDESAHLWDISKDAKDGDVLVCESGWTCIFKTLVNDEAFSSYCFMDKTKWFCETGSEGHTLNKEFMEAYNGEIKPATKEQRDTLFAKMHEAGYMWDSESKQLLFLKAEPRYTQNPAWSEEDERILDALITSLNNEVFARQLKTLKGIGVSSVINWLKSIKHS